MALVELEPVGHEGDDERLADRLAAGDRQCIVVIGTAGEYLFEKEFARHGFDRLEHPLVPDALVAERH